MSVEEAYNVWAGQYDTNNNRTRDMEGVVMKSVLSSEHVVHHTSCLEIGCGTGKNTIWIADAFASVVSVDFSEQMLSVARDKLSGKSTVAFHLSDITQQWSLSSETFDMITFSLVLEHIADLDFVFAEVAAKAHSGSLVYIGELHPFKQYAGTKARFESATGTQELTCYIHHMSDFTHAGAKHGFRLLQLDEHFDDDDRQKNIPRVLSLLLLKE